MNYTEQLIDKALHDPNLAPPGGCKYVDANGCRCIAGTVLHLAGVPDDILKGRDWKPTGTINEGDDPNTISLVSHARYDLRNEAVSRGIDPEALLDYQRQWDDKDSGGFSESIVDQYREIHGNG